MKRRKLCSSSKSAACSDFIVAAASTAGIFPVQNHFGLAPMNPVQGDGIVGDRIVGDDIVGNRIVVTVRDLQPTDSH